MAVSRAVKRHEDAAAEPDVTCETWPWTHSASSSSAGLWSLDSSATGLLQTQAGLPELKIIPAADQPTVRSIFVEMLKGRTAAIQFQCPAPRKDGTLAHLEFERNAAGCHCGRGYLFSRPIPASQFEVFAAKQG
jgi:hypothetical protein